MKNSKKIFGMLVITLLIFISIAPLVNSLSMEVTNVEEPNNFDLDRLYEDVKAELKEYEDVDSTLIHNEYYPGAPSDPNVAYYEFGTAIVMCKALMRVENIDHIEWKDYGLAIYDKDKIPELNAFRVSVSDVDAFIRDFKRDNYWVRDIERSYTFSTFWTPNDEYWGEQWGPKAINCPSAWNKQKGSINIHVAVIDTGCDYEHYDIPCNPPSYVWDFVNEDSDPMDDGGHGTHCSGIIGATMNNNRGISGVADCFVDYFKVLDSDGSGFTFDIAAAIVRAATRVQNLKVISMSLGGRFGSILLGAACKYAHDIHNVLVVAAAGNSGNDALIAYPARYFDVLSVGAVNEGLDICQFSSGGKRADILAPGEGILSTIPNNRYDSYSGTSMAAPHVAGVAALYFSEHPFHGAKLCKSALLNTATRLNGGAKLVNAAGVLGLAKSKAILTNPLLSNLQNLFPHASRLFQRLFT
jgi:subtilisin family serine protease